MSETTPTRAVNITETWDENALTHGEPAKYVF